MAGENIIDWNFTNWITVCIMAAISFAIAGFVFHAISSSKKGASS
jgi:hypothetical protein